MSAMDHPRLTMRAFCEIARQVIDQLPDPFREKLENVVVDVESRPSAARLREEGLGPEEWDQLLGYFEGAPLTDQSYGERHPNRITVYKDSIEVASRSAAEIAYEIRRTLMHELAHHFGFSEEDLESFEAKPSPFDEERE
jgi:predicted Zn-dependent protease with MMP-like domain